MELLLVVVVVILLLPGIFQEGHISAQFMVLNMAYTLVNSTSAVQVLRVSCFLRDEVVRFASEIWDHMHF